MELTPDQEARQAEYRHQSTIDNVFHRWINRRQEERRTTGEPWEKSLYEWKTAMLERKRLVIWLKRARTGDLPTNHQQCSHSPVESLSTNKLICARGVDVTECPILQSLYAHVASGTGWDELSPDDADVMAADVCAWHIFTGTIGHEDTKDQWSRFDTSEGYVQDESDRRFWSKVYRHMSMSDPADEA